MDIDISKIQVGVNISNDEVFRIKLWDTVPATATITISFPGMTKTITMSQLRSIVRVFEGFLGAEK